MSDKVKPLRLSSDVQAVLDELLHGLNMSLLQAASFYCPKPLKFLPADVKLVKEIDLVLNL